MRKLPISAMSATLAACLALPAQAQMISQLVNGPFMGGSQGEGQSFTSTQTGTIKRISVRPGLSGGPGTPTTLYLYNGGVGSGILDDPGTPAYTQSSLSLSEGLQDDPMQDLVLSTPFPVTAGQRYTFVLEGNGSTPSLYLSSDNPYPGGQRIMRYSETIPLQDMDLAFQIWTQWTQTLAFTSAAPTNAQAGGTYTPAAQATSSLAPEFSVASSSSAVCALNGADVTFIGPGTCLLNADQPGNADYEPAPQVQQSFTVAAAPIAYTIGGTVSGLTGSGLVLRNNGGDDLPVSTDGSFVFSTLAVQDGLYEVTVAEQPAGQTCTVSNGSGTASGDVTSVQVDCQAQPPVGPGPGGVQPVPTLGESGVLLLSALAGLLGWRARRRANRA